MSDLLPWAEQPMPAFSREGDRRGIYAGHSPACIFAHTVSWAVCHGIPIDRAVLSMPAYNSKHNRLPLALFAYGPTFWRLIDPIPSWLSGRYFFSRHLDGFIQELCRGAPLSCAMRDNLGGLLPDYYLAGVDRAEQEGRLEVALPALARQLEIRTTLAEEASAVNVAFMVKALAIVAVLGFTLTSVLPKFHDIFFDLIGTGEPVVFHVGALKAALWATIGVFLWFTLLVPAALSSSRRFDMLFMRIPIVRILRQRTVMADTALSMAVLLRQGDDVVRAAEWCIASTRSPWMARRLQQFVDAVRMGQPWDQAWAAMRVGKPLHQWFIRNAATLETPAEGFELLADWLRHETDSFVRRIRVWIDPIGTVALASIVAWIACTMFGILVRIILGLL
jgi:type II secretory pathway component PulF